jgi:hypothetical protein
MSDSLARFALARHGLWSREYFSCVTATGKWTLPMPCTGCVASRHIRAVLLNLVPTRLRISQNRASGQVCVAMPSCHTSLRM